MKRNSKQLIDYIDALDNQQELRGDPYHSETRLVKEVAYVFLTRRQLVRVLLYSLGIVKKL